MRVLVCGDRNWGDERLIHKHLFEVASAVADWAGLETWRDADLTVIDGCARGADTLGHKVAMDMNFPFLRFPANWAKFGKAAGFIRNQQMLDEGKPDLVLAFHDDIEHSKGTKDMVNRARKAGIDVRVVTHVQDIQTR